jgi:type IV pilus assembly protein PilN
MIRINLLPHREEKDKQRRKSFYALLVLSGISALLIIILFAGYMAKRISDQGEVNQVIKTENIRLDGQIKEVSTLKQEIQALKARQQAVEDLQADRNQPVYLMSELVQQTPEGIYLRGFKQDGQRVVLSGYAQSNERVAEFLRNISNNSAWLERPDLVEIRSVSLGQGKDAKKVFDFSINVGIKRPRDKEQPTSGSPDGSAAKAAASADTRKP